MSSAQTYRVRHATALCDLAVCFAAFWAVSLLFKGVQADWAVIIPLSAMSSWVASLGFHARELGLSFWLDHFFYSTGLNMLLQYGTAYALPFHPPPLAAVAAGAALAIALIGLLRASFYPRLERQGSGVLLVGFDSVSAAIAPYLERPILGALASDPARLPAGIPFLGGPAQLNEAVAKNRPGGIVVSGEEAPVSALLGLQYSGATVLDASAMYETKLGRLRWDRLRPTDLLFSGANSADRIGMAFQSIYTNVIGLALLLILSPLLIVAAAVTTLAAAGGPVLESTECLGFQMIPFHLQRFATRRKDGSLHWAGRALSALRLTRLPGLINVVRGEMAFFGPPPVRVEFARRLTALIPVYSHRFTIKPGMFGWSQTNLAARRTGPAGPADEALRLEYDLYYVKQNSVSLDLEVLLRTVFPPRSRAAMPVRFGPGGDV